MGDSTPTQTEKIASEKSIQEAFPLLAKALSIKGDSIVGFTPEQFEALKNYEQQKLDKLTENFGIAIKDSLTKLAESLKAPAPVPSSKVEAATPTAVKSVNKETYDSAISWLKVHDSPSRKFTLDKNEYLRSMGYVVAEDGNILGRSATVKATEAITTATQPLNYDRDAIFVPGGQLPLPVRQFVRVKPTGNGNGTVAFYTGTNATYGAITEGSAPSEDSITITQVTGSPTTRGTFLKVKYSWLEDNPFSIVDYLAQASMKAAIDAETTEILSTLVSAATNATGQWFNGNSGATITAGAGTSGNDDTSGMTLTITGVSKAKNALDVDGYGPQGPYVFAVHPKNLNELIISSGISTFVQQGMPEITRNGIMSGLLGVNLAMYDQVYARTNTTNNTYQNVMFVPQQAFALGVGREVTVKAEEHSELQQVYWTSTHRIVAKVLDNNAWCRVSCAQ